VLFCVLGTAAFLAFCFTIGGRWLARIIRWTNDHFVIQMPVISLILVITITLALVTNFIGVHTVLGAFAAGIMIGQSPILTKHIEEQLRGLIVALFMPVFFGVAGLAIGSCQGCGAMMTALNISAPPAENELLRRPNELLRTGRAFLEDIVALGEREGVRVRSKAFVGPAKESAILRQATLGGHQLIVLGTKAWSGDRLHFGHSAEVLIENAPCPILIVKS
jgi:nucleotide-binding universal stress UspA family protein